MSNVQTFNRAIATILDVIVPQHLEDIRDSNTMRSGVVVFQFLFGDKALRYLYTNHTYCVLELFRRFGLIYFRSATREEAGNQVPVSMELSILTTICVRLMQEHADDHEGKLSEPMAVRIANTLMTKMGVPDDYQTLVRREVRDQHRIGSRGGKYHNTQHVVLTLAPSKTQVVSPKVIPLRAG